VGTGRGVGVSVSILGDSPVHRRSSMGLAITVKLTRPGRAGIARMALQASCAPVTQATGVTEPISPTAGTTITPQKNPLGVLLFPVSNNFVRLHHAHDQAAKRSGTSQAVSKILLVLQMATLTLP
jgi:hypothetical protein